VDFLFSTSFTNAGLTKPTNYDEFRLVAAFKTDSSANVFLFTQVGDYFRYTEDVILDVNDTIADGVFEIGTLSVPPSSIAHIYGRITNNTETSTQGILHIRTNSAADSAGAERWAGMNFAATAGAFREINSVGMVLVDSSSRVQYAGGEAAGDATIDISTFGFWMLTRRDP